MLCIAVVGLPGAGKSEFLKLAIENEFTGLEWSAILSKDLKSGSLTRQEAHKATEIVVQSRGISYYPEKIFEMLCTTDGIGHIVSGARNPRELECLLSYYSESRVVWISSNYLARFSRCNARQRMNKKIDLAEFLHEDMYELSHGLAEIAHSLANDILFNDSGLDEYRKVILSYLGNISLGQRGYK